MTPFEQAALWVAIITGILGSLGNIAQVVLHWFTLREIGDMDGDRKDWFEKAPWRKYRGDE